jgi:hypothetical protein
MSDQPYDSNDQAEGAIPQHYHQEKREERHQPEPKAVEGYHAGRHVPEDMQRQERHDTEIGVNSRVAGQGGDQSQGDGMEGNTGVGANYGTSGDSSRQGTTSTMGGPEGPVHARNHGRNAEGAFGEETPDNNAPGQSDYRDAGIARREAGGPNKSKGNRTQGGDW